MPEEEFLPEVTKPQRLQSFPVFGKESWFQGPFRNCLAIWIAVESLWLCLGLGLQSEEGERNGGAPPPRTPPPYWGAAAPQTPRRVGPGRGSGGRGVGADEFRALVLADEFGA